jgi:hypothetical protein
MHDAALVHVLQSGHQSVDALAHLGGAEVAVAFLDAVEELATG